MDKLLENIEKYIIFATIFLISVVVLAISPNPFVLPKLATLVFGVGLFLLIRSIRVINAGKLDISLGNFDFPVFLLGLAFVLSTLLRTPNKMDAVLLPGTATALVGATLLYFIINQFKSREKEIMTKILFISSAFFAVFVLLSFAGVFAKIPQLPPFFRTQGFTPEGGYLPAVIFLSTMLPIGLGLIFSQKQIAQKALFAVSLAVIILGLSVSIYNILPGKTFNPRFPSFGTSWYVAVDALKESPIFGVGPGDYLTAFTRFRPLSYNTTELWAVRFTTARNFFLTTMTETGMLGVAGMVLLLYAIFKSAKKEFKETKLVNWGLVGRAPLFSLLILVLVLLLAPATTLLIVLLFILLALNSETKHTSLNLTTQGPASDQATQIVTSRLPSLLITLPIIILVGLVFYRSLTLLRAELQFKLALDKLAQNDASGTYDTMREAIRLNPQVDRYHATFARVNLALANAIATRAQEATAGQNENQEGQAQVSEEDRQNISLLIQQAINEGKASVALNPLRSGNWEVLGQVYRAIMPLAQGADAFAIQTYRQAVALDPLNPNLRIALGGVHYSLGDFESAVRVFELATAAKPDHANAHYNLAIALRDKGDLNRALAEMSLVLSLVDRESPDYEVARKSLEDIQSKQQGQAGTGAELVPPQPAGEPVIEPQLDLPEGSEPPEAPLSPTPTPEEGETQSTPTISTPDL